MRYRNKKTKAEISSDTKISGGDWVEVKPRGKAKAAEEVPEEDKDKQVDPENGSPDGGTDNE